MADNQRETGADAAEQEDVLTMDDAGQSAESWQDELPPEDDFHDQDQDPIEEVIDEIPDERVAETAVDGSRRGKAILLGVLVVGGLLIGGLGYLQFKGSDKVTGSGAIPLARVMDIKSLDKPQSPKAPTATGSTATAPDPAEIDRMYDVSTMQPSGKTTVPNGDSKEFASEKPIENISSEVVGTSASLPAASDLPAVKPQLDTASLPPHPVKTEVIPVPATTSLIPAKTAAPTPLQVTAPVVDDKKVKEAEERIKTLTEQLATLQKSFDQIKVKNDELVLKLEAAGKVASTPTANEIALQQKVADLQKQIAAQANVTEVKQKPESAVVQAPAPREERPSKKAPQQVKQARQTTSKAPSWVLRAATPNAAWISAGKNSEDLKQVTIGQTVPGLGKIKEIRPAGDRWELVGSRATLR